MRKPTFVFAVAFLVAIAFLAVVNEANADCNDGDIASCKIGDKEGTKECFNGRWTPCMIENEQPTPDPRNSPTGTFTAVSRSPDGLVVSGTATDPDAAGPVEVAIWVSYGYAGSVWASGPGGAFSGTVPARAGTKVCAWAINRNQGVDQSLGCYPLTVVVNPFGALDRMSADADGLNVRGWAIDPDTAAPIVVHVYVDGVFVQAITAAMCCRGDIDAKYPQYGTGHVYAARLPMPPRGRHNACVYAINVGPGDTNIELGCSGTFTSLDISPEAGGPRPLGDILSLETVPQPGKRVRVRDDSTVYIAPIDGMTEMDVTDARFRKVRGLDNSNCVSFESIKYPGRFLRHEDNRIRLHGGGVFGGLSFNADATFCSDGIRYESVNKRGYYIRDAGSDLVLVRLVPSTDPLYDRNAFLDTGLYEHLPATLGFYQPGPLTYEGEYTTTELHGACTGLAPWIGRPPKRCVVMMFEKDPFVGGSIIRTVESCAVGTPLAGFYPWIKSTQDPTNWDSVFKIEKGVTPCVW